MNTNDVYSGLMTQGAQVPLQGVHIHARLEGLCSRITVSQRYRNLESVDVEAVYIFPLEEGSAVSGFEAQIGDRRVVGQVKEREEAFEAYDDAMAEGHGAFLLDQERPNVFTASVGNLKPNQEVIVRLTYVAVLNHEGSAVRLMLPTTVSPRYTPASPTNVGQPDAERVSPPTVGSVPYGLTLEVDVAMGAALSSVESPTHNIRTVLGDEGRATVTLSQRQAALDRDFVLLVEPRTASKPVALVGREEDGTRVVMVSFRPDETAMPARSASEVVFLLDCSGSMSGDSIEEARRALALSLRTLDQSDTFNIVCFGSSHASLWDAPKPYNQANLDIATGYLAQVGANMGGTEILRPLQAITASAPAEGRVRQVVLLTDGQVSNEADVIELCRKHAGHTRVFAFGIGAGVSEHLVRGVARASRGAAEFITPGERVEPKVLRMSGRLGSPALQNASIEWHGVEAEMARSMVPPVFVGDVLTVFGRVVSGSTDKVTLVAGERRWSVPVDLEHAQAQSALPSLWARGRITELEDKLSQRRGSAQRRPSQETRRVQQIIELGKRYGLMTSHTSYVAIEERPPSERTQNQAELRRVPVALTHGWGGSNRIGGRGAGGFGGTMAPPPVQGFAAMAPPPAAMAPPAPKSRGEARVLGRIDPSALASKGEAHSRGRRGPVPPGAPARPKPAARRRSKAKADQGFLGRGGGGGGIFEEKKMRDMSPSFDESFAMAEDAEMEELEGLAAFEQDIDRLFGLLMSQRADGSFPVSDDLRGWLGARWASVEAAMTASADAQVFVTALVVALLKKEASGRSGEWAAAASKAERWLAGRGDGLGIEGLL